MPKYVFIYREQEVVDVSTIPEEEVKKIMQAWGEWLGTMGSSVVDAGDAFKAGSKAVSQEGVVETDGLTSAYTIVEAADYDEALQMAQGNPSIKEGTRIEVYEAFGL